jgi:adenine-specific DNA-methyltransferase
MAKTFTCNAEYSEHHDATVRVADCRDFLASLPTSCAQLVLTSPPYNIRKCYEQKPADLEEYVSLQRQAIAESARVLKDGASLCWQIGTHVNARGEILPLDMLLWPAFADLVQAGTLRLRNRIVWHFEHGLHCVHRFSGRHEVVLWFTKGDGYKFRLDRVRVPQKYPNKRAYTGPRRGQLSGNPLGKNPGDVWIIPNVKSNHVEKTEHPCQFPIELAERLILSLTDRNDLVVDPFAGVGSSLAAAVLHGRRAAGCDISARYVSIAKKRIRAASMGTLRYRPLTTTVHSPVGASVGLRRAS